MKKILLILFFAFYTIFIPFVFVDCGGEDLPYNRLSGDSAADGSDPTADVNADCICDRTGVLTADCVDFCTSEAAAAAADTDSDGIPDNGSTDGTPCSTALTTNCDDNCPNDANPDQTDKDGNGIGDACE